jgi:hypothetical protein
VIEIAREIVTDDAQQGAQGGRTRAANVEPLRAGKHS